MHTSSRNSQCTVGVNGNWSTRNLAMHFFNIEVRLETYRISNLIQNTVSQHREGGLPIMRPDVS